MTKLLPTFHPQRFFQVRSRETTLQTMWNSLTVRGPSAHIQCYSYHACTSVIVSGGGRNSTVLGHSSLTRFFPWRFPDFQLNSQHFSDSCQNSGHFQVFRTSGHPEEEEHEACTWIECLWWQLLAIKVSVQQRASFHAIWTAERQFAHVLRKSWEVTDQLHTTTVRTIIILLLLLL